MSRSRPTGPARVPFTRSDGFRNTAPDETRNNLAIRRLTVIQQLNIDALNHANGGA
jgi:hypothetical protein